MNDVVAVWYQLGMIKSTLWRITLCKYDNSIFNEDSSNNYVIIFIIDNWGYSIVHGIIIITICKTCDNYDTMNNSF